MQNFNLEALEEPITRILSAPGTDLTTISAKRVRKALLGDPQYAYLGLTPEIIKIQRTDVDQLIAQVFEHVNEAASCAEGPKRKRGEEYEDEDEAEREAEREEDEGVGVSAGPTEPSEGAGEAEDVVAARSLPKKKKNKKSVEESDAALARKLAAEINSRSRRGATLAAMGSSLSSPRKAKRKPKKSARMVDSEGEDGEDRDGKEKKRGTAKGGFAREYLLSDPLSAVLEVEKLSRPQVVKKLWEYIRRHQLQNPLNKKEILCDDALRAVFAVDKIDMFRMNKVLGQHLHEG